MKPITDQLDDALLFKPSKARRLPVAVDTTMPDFCVVCPACRPDNDSMLLGADKPSMFQPNMEYVVLTRYVHTSGLVWVGKCGRCELLLYTTRLQTGGVV